MSADCKCLNDIDNKLREKGLSLTGYSFLFSGNRMVSRPTIKTDWIDRQKAPKGKRNSPPPMFASHCPFCGNKYAALEKEKL